MTTEFVFVRHGETQANRAGILQGGGVNLPLNDNGRTQAGAAADYLKQEKFDAAFASDLRRAAETAEIIVKANQHGVPLELTAGLQEWNCGEMDGLSFEEIGKRFPREGRSFAFEQIETQMPGGELGTDFQARIDRFMMELVQKFPGKRILLVAHGGTLQRIFRLVSGAVKSDNLLPLAGNASISSFLYNHELNAWQLTSWNMREHLKDIPQHLSRVL